MIIGITGNMGSGKSTVGTILRDLGYFVLDADKICHELYRQGTFVYDFIVELFGNEILNEDLSINRRQLSSFMFSDLNKKEKLEKFVHNAILEELKIQSSNSKNKVIFWEVPLLFEARFNEHVDCVFYVASNKNTMISRVKNRDSLSEEKIQERLQFQKDWTNYLTKNDYLIVNDGTLLDLESKIKQILDHINHC